MVKKDTQSNVVLEEKIDVVGNNVQETIDNLVGKAQGALEKFLLLDQEAVDYIVTKAATAAVDQHGPLAVLAQEETQKGVFEDKAIKNLFAAEYVTNNMINTKTVGVINEDPMTGITEIAEPVGVIAALTPTTNPTSTVIFKALIALKTRNPIIFSVHPNAEKSSQEAARVLYEAAVLAGAPENCIQWIESPSLEKTDALMNHPGVATILATGGSGMVKAAYSCGKPALGVGPGNVPAYVDHTANIKRSAYDIVLSKAFDNGMICASEQAVILDKSIHDNFIKEMERYHTYVATDREKELLEQYFFGDKKSDGTRGGLNAAAVGQPAAKIAANAGFEVPEDTVVIAVHCSHVGYDEPLTREKLAPVLAVLKANNREEGVSLAAQMVELNGLGHSASVHSEDEAFVKEYSSRVKAMRVIWNAPSTFGGIGDVYNAFIPSLTLGCGSYGANSTSDNISANNLLNIKRIGRRNNNMQWFKIPPKIYFEPNSVHYLAEIDKMSRVVIITDEMMVKLGYVQRVLDVLHVRPDKPIIEVISNILPDPTVEMVIDGAERLREIQPDTIIALGGGSPMDAAKVMWLLYEHPEANFDDLKQKFMDIRKRTVKFPKLGSKAQMIAIPTTSGTGSEVTPFAVITDKSVNKKYPLADYSLTPNVAIIDPEFVLNLPARGTADTGLDVLTHAVEAFVSIMANDYTDGLALQAIKLVFKYLPRAYKLGSKDPEARAKMHNASAMAAMAFSNAFLGINHSLAHKIGGMFGTVHGRTNAILMPHVIRYNGTVPGKLHIWPKYESYVADERYQEIAQMLGLPASSPAEGVESFAQACIDLAIECDVEMNLKSFGVDEQAFMDNLNLLAMNAYEDQCSPVNPRQPLIKDLEQILFNAYYGINTPHDVSE